LAVEQLLKTPDKCNDQVLSSPKGEIRRNHGTTTGGVRL